MDGGAPVSERGLPRTPDGWSLVRVARLGPFAVRAVYRRPDGSEVEWTSRRHRKGQEPVPLTGPGPKRVVPRRTWWIAALFSIGSACFAVGSVPAFIDAVSPRTDALVYFVGSLFFTSAALLSFLEAAAAPAEVRSTPSAPGRRRTRHLGWFRGRSIDWWATAVQLAGTLWFNAMTWRAFRDDVAADQVNQLVWRPDVLGSICFLVASWLAFAEVTGAAGWWRPRDVSWWIVALNLAGSVAFGFSALAAFTLPNGEVANVRLDDLGTLVGAICFLVAAVLLVPEAARRPTTSD